MIEAEAAPAPGMTGLLINSRARRGAMAEAAVLDALRRRGVSPSHVARVKRPRSLVQAVDAKRTKRE